MGDVPTPTASDQGNQPYRVLARKYRPEKFADIVGQEAMVETLQNAIRQNRLAHAFIFTGIRGTGKTTTARLLAKVLNCTGHEGEGPVLEACGLCENCRAIRDDRHVDILEMDAASHTGVDHIREIIDAVRYRPSSARYKVYIIDEVHMLSTSAFNALLKTLEEPPPHVKFIFATTEIRKVPVTVLSRCQRYDLRRIDAKILADYFTQIAGKEGWEIEEDAAMMIGRAADGSARDGLSILDQAGALAQGKITAAIVKSMLGLMDAAQIGDLLFLLLEGKITEGLALYQELYQAGADPLLILQDLLGLLHEESKKAALDAASSPYSVPALTRAWQILLKGIEEVQMASFAHQAAEMIFIRLAYATKLPLPNAQAAGQGAAQAANITATAPSSAPNPAIGFADGGADFAMAAAPAEKKTLKSSPTSSALSPSPPVVSSSAPRSKPQLAATPAPKPSPQSFRDVVNLCEAHRELRLAYHLRHDLHLVSEAPQKLVFNPRIDLPVSFCGDLAKWLQSATGETWQIEFSKEAGAPTLDEEAAQEKQNLFIKAAEDPLVKAALDAFPGAQIRDIKSQPKQDKPSNQSAA